MAEYSANALQIIEPGAQAIFTETPVPSTNGLIYHRDESGLFRLASASRITGRIFGGCACFRRMLQSVYGTDFHANIEIPEGGTVGPISLAIAIDGTIDPSSTMIFTPAALEQFGNVGTGIEILVPAICGCESVSVVNTSTQAIGMQNANLRLFYRGITY